MRQSRFSEEQIIAILKEQEAGRSTAERRRFGYRRLHLMLKREGVRVNHKKLFRLYREEKLVVRKRGSLNRALSTQAPMTIPQGANQRWSLDFVSVALGDGCRYRVLCMVDDLTRECLALVADTSLSGSRIARELDAVIARRGKPHLVVSDNGTEFTRQRCCVGNTKQVLNGITSLPANRNRMALSRVLVGGSEMKC